MLDGHSSLKTPIFILGSPRSGTTILANAFRKAGYFGYDEGHLLNMLLPVKRAIELHINDNIAQEDGQLLYNLKSDFFLDDIYLVFKKFQDLLNPKIPWLDKTPDADMIRTVPILSRLWPTAAFVFAKRRGIETIVSRLKKFPSTTFEKHCIYWSEAMEAWRQVRDSGIDAIEVDQIDIARDAPTTAARLGAFVRMNEVLIPKMRDEMLNSRPQRTDEQSTGRITSLGATGWTAQQVDFFRAQCWREMDAYRYTFDEGYREHA